MWRTAERERSEDLLLGRFEKGGRVPRVNNPDRGPHKDIDYYNTFGATIIGTNEPVDRILETRAIQINMPEAVRVFNNDVTPEIGRPLKERLTAFRARHLWTVLPETPKPAQGRLGDILKPLLQIIRLARPEWENQFTSLVREV